MTLRRQPINGPWDSIGRPVGFDTDHIDDVTVELQSNNQPSRGGTSSSNLVGRNIPRNSSSSTGEDLIRGSLPQWYDTMPEEFKQRLALNPYRNTEPTQGIFESWAKFQARWNAWKADYDAYNAKIYDEYLISIKSSSSYQLGEQMAAGVNVLHSQVDSSLASQAISPTEPANNPAQYDYDNSQVLAGVETAIGAFSTLFSAGITGATTAATLKIAEQQAKGLEYDNSIKALNAFEKASSIVGSSIVEIMGKYHETGVFDIDTGDESANNLLRAAFDMQRDSVRRHTAEKNAENDLLNSVNAGLQAEKDNIVLDTELAQDYTIRNDDGKVVTDNATLGEYMKHVNRLRYDSYAVQSLIDLRQSLLDGVSIDNQIDYFNTFSKLSGTSYGSFQASSDFNVQKVEQDLNNAINKMRKSVYDAFDWLYQKAESGNGFAIAGCATLGAASFSLPRAVVSDFLGTMNANRQARLNRETQYNSAVARQIVNKQR